MSDTARTARRHDALPAVSDTCWAYVELHAHSAYSFLDGASLPEELAARAAELGYDALALTDHDGVYGSLEFAHAAKHFGVRPITGAEVSLRSTSSTGRAARTSRCSARRSAATRTSAASSPTRTRGTRVPGRERELLPPRDDARGRSSAHAEGLVCLSGCARHGLGVVDPNGAARLARAFAGAFYVELQRPYERGDARRNARLEELAATLGVPTVATGDVHAHHPRRARLQDALVAIRNRTSLDGCERERRGNHESVLLPPHGDARAAPARRGAAHARGRRPLRVRPDAGARLPLPRLLRRRRTRPTCSCARSATARSPSATDASANGHKRRARERLDDELALIARLGLAGFFLLHWEVLELARECALEVRGPGSPRHALPPGRGRGSSVGSIVCYLTGLSHVDPVEANLSLGRFINDEMVAVPDIDLDFPRDIREKLIVARHRALRPRARGARRELRDLPQPRRDPRRRQGARAAVRRARAARARHRRLGRDARRRGARRRSRRRTRARAGRRSAS